MKWTVKGKYDKGSYVEDFGTGDHNFCRCRIFEDWFQLNELQEPF